MDWRIPLFKIYWDEDDIAAVNKVISRGINWAVGPEVAQFEEKLAEYLGVRYCVTFNSGTSALHAVLLAFGIGAGDEVIIPSFTFIATANAALFVGAKPIFADIKDETCALDPEAVEGEITLKTKVVIPIHYGGCPCRIMELKEIARRHNLILIEDAAESLGADINGVKVGTVGDAAILSFCQNKIITTGEGGAVVTDSTEISKKLKLIRSHGRPENTDYFSSIEPMDYVALGYNFRMSSISAALGLAQLNKLDTIIEMRRSNAQFLNNRLSQIKGIITPVPPSGFHHVYQMYTIRVPAHLREGLIRHLADCGIMSRVPFHPVHKTHFYRSELGYDCVLPETETMSEQVLNLPMYPSLTEDEIDYVAGEATKFFLGKQ